MAPQIAADLGDGARHAGRRPWPSPGTPWVPLIPAQQPGGGVGIDDEVIRLVGGGAVGLHAGVVDADDAEGCCR